MNIDHPLVGRSCTVAAHSPRHAGRSGIIVGVSGDSAEFVHAYLDDAEHRPFPQREMYPLGDVIIKTRRT